MNFANILSEMKKILVFGVFLAIFNVASVDAAGRDGATNTNARTKAVQVTTQSKNSGAGKVDVNRSAAVRKPANTVQRTAKSKNSTRSVSTPGRVTTQTQRTATRSGTLGPISNRAGTVNTTRSKTTPRAKTVRAATNTDTATSETRTGAAYEQCKSAYFQCMDQFCSLKNEEYRRCSCSDRVIDLADVRTNLTETNSKLTEFTENLDIVGMTAAQATALHTASDGENALTADTSASKALLQAIMNSIRGEDSTVGGKMSDLNSINISFDTANAFGITDSAQLVAQYNGSALYSAVYPNCRNAVRSDCTDAALQRAVTAYLMSIEQDCNTVQTALVNKQKELKAAVREGSAMLDLARIENRKKHNSDDFTACLGNVESAVLSEQVCGEDYHKCLDNGEYIDVTTGAPIVGVVGFANLGRLLKFADGIQDATDQRLSMVADNKKFVTNFENKTKKFAKDALDKCSEISDDVWTEYLDRAMLSIYYAQQEKVKTIKQGCFDLITACYNDRNTAITAAMNDLINGTIETSLIPDKITLTQLMCDDYIQSCTSMFNPPNIIQEYVDMQKDTDTLAACRAVVQQCFTKYGGTNYENFYYPASGLFQPNLVDTTEDERPNTPLVRTALDWFTLYEYDETNNRVIESRDETTNKCIPKYKSPCAQEVAQIESCRDKIEEVFGGLDMIIAQRKIDESYKSYTYVDGTNSQAVGYGWVKTNNNVSDSCDNIQLNFGKFTNRRLRPTGVATEVYNNIVDNLQNQCLNANGRFVEAQYIIHTANDTNEPGKDFCKLYYFGNHATSYGFSWNGTDNSSDYYENVCPRDYEQNVDVHAWGICSCWENGGRRSLGGLSSKCEAVLPTSSSTCSETLTLNDNNFSASSTTDPEAQSNPVPVEQWCPAETDATSDQVKPATGNIPGYVPRGLRAADQ